LGHRGDRDLTIQHVFEVVGTMLLPSPDGGVFDGDEFLVGIFESAGASRDWPECGSEAWSRLREVALRRVVARLASEGLLDFIAVNPGAKVARWQ